MGLAERLRRLEWAASERLNRQHELATCPCGRSTVAGTMGAVVRMVEAKQRGEQYPPEIDLCPYCKQALPLVPLSVVRRIENACGVRLL